MRPRQCHERLIILLAQEVDAIRTFTTDWPETTEVWESNIVQCGCLRVQSRIHSLRLYCQLGECCII